MSYGEYIAPSAEDREPGRRRRKIAGFLRAANEIRQNYFGSEDSGRDMSDESGTDGPGAFPDAAVVRSGNEEMVLFPSYARRHTKSKLDIFPGSNTSEQEFWRQEWEKHQNDKAVVHVDVRGWIYTPHRGQHTRKQRLLIGIARQMSGVPAPPSTSRLSEGHSSSATPSRASSPTRTSSKQEEDLISFEAEQIVRRGEAEAHNARQGRYSEVPGQGGVADADGVYGTRSCEPSPTRGSRHSQYSVASDNGGLSPPVSPIITPLQHRPSWLDPSKMGPNAVATANAHLLNRIKPFLATPLANSPISAFFYNDHASRQHTVHTDPQGHFAFHTALDFVPTHVRVLASDKLSVTEEIVVTSPKGVSLISDIDDTIKHSGVSHGAREIFRNAFVRELADMTIDGVREWYMTMKDMGVQLHYVSNSPWQMYPVLATYFKLAGLPKGSFHLKHYSGALAGIFEPVAERKKSSLAKIMRDFPERKFILVGDSGEADLEVYTDVALDNPGRILGIFIRDVTTLPRTGYFDPSTSLGSSRSHSRNRSGDTLAKSKRFSRPESTKDDDEELQAAIAASLADMEKETLRARRKLNPDVQLDSIEDRMPKPALPARPGTLPKRIDSSMWMSASPQEEDLIDFSEELPPPKPWPLPAHPSPLSQVIQQSPTETTKRPPLPARPKTYQKISHAVGSVLGGQPIPTQPRPPGSSGNYLETPRQLSSASHRSIDDLRAPLEMPKASAPLPPPPRKGGHTYPFSSSATRQAPDRLSGGWDEQISASSLPATPTEAGMSKKEWLWQQRLQKAKAILEPRGVTVRTWRVGSDVADVCVKLAEMEFRRIEREEKGVQ
ncbi:hypothetical protein M433DRAFT_68286 [Acidomyces richmondensis BFW]|nr:MAG: hypothetical protein FE78DRAFT_150202 [Acidomyces sp. 'richmondensis']KYG44973.1 hypothetical protein M433DRAFT_68286 [Acidomyces richmondensis BFW]